MSQSAYLGCFLANRTAGSSQALIHLPKRRKQSRKVIGVHLGVNFKGLLDHRSKLAKGCAEDDHLGDQFWCGQFVKWNGFDCSLDLLECDEIELPAPFRKVVNRLAVSKLLLRDMPRKALRRESNPMHCLSERSPLFNSLSDLQTHANPSGPPNCGNRCNSLYPGSQLTRGRHPASDYGCAYHGNRDSRERQHPLLLVHFCTFFWEES